MEKVKKPLYEELEIEEVPLENEELIKKYRYQINEQVLEDLEEDIEDE